MLLPDPSEGSLVRLDLKDVPSSIRKTFSPVMPFRSTPAPVGFVVKTADAFPLASPILFVIFPPLWRFKIASVSAKIFPDTLALVRVPIVD